MNFSRRTFLGSFAAAVAAPRFLRAEAPLAKVGILSDTHVTTDPKMVEPLMKAFRRFAAEGVGTVVISGDVCEVGTLAELKCVTVAKRTARPSSSASSRRSTPEGSRVSRSGRSSRCEVESAQ